ncbi:ankyrin repeat domain-containing protein [Bdellovibrio sp. HCB337]|uniref:ankyrin repeat domain-containing protein n=1 Tax=Bdellovibrio sp. HCB337 TaxID=3394358 RepID=UPI0039A40B5B
MRNYDEYRKQNTESVKLFVDAKIGNTEAFADEKALSPYLDINIKDHKGYSPLMYAAYYNHIDLVKWLITNGADVESPDRGGNTILMGVAFKGHIEVAQHLIRAGADVSATNLIGMNALQFAQMFGRHDMAVLLDGAQEGFFRRTIQQVRLWGFYIAQKLQSKKEITNGL